MCLHAPLYSPAACRGALGPSDPYHVRVYRRKGFTLNHPTSITPEPRPRTAADFSEEMNEPPSAKLAAAGAQGHADKIQCRRTTL